MPRPGPMPLPPRPAFRRARVAGHLGEFLQGRIGPGGPVALLTLPCDALAVTGLWRPGPFALHQSGAPVLSRAQAQALLLRLGLPVAGAYTLRAAMPPGGGAGSSTASLLALAHLAGGGALPPEVLARATIAVEGASDPLMFQDPGRLLWASRRGEVLAHLPPLPPIEVLGGFLGPARRTDPGDSDFPDVADLVADLPRAMEDAAALAALASESAARSLALRGAGPGADPTARLARELGALGHAIGHTGPARALLFRPGTIPPEARARLLSLGYRGLVAFRPDRPG